MEKKEVKIEGLVKTNYKEISLNIFEKFRDVKLIVFDFDNTLYQNIDWQGYNEFVLKNIRKIFKRLTDKQFEDLLKKYNYTGDRVIEKFAYMVLKEKGSTKKFYKFVKK